MTAASTFSITVGASSTSARVYPSDNAQAAVVLAHGAGAPQAHPWLVGLARVLSARALAVVTFDFVYMTEKRRVPDKNDVLEATWLAALRAVRARGETARARLFIGGKSMGGRIATQIAARQDVDVSGVVLLGYPLHPPGKPDRLRAAHLPLVRAPMLFVQGSRDAFGSPDELAPIMQRLASGSRLFVVEGGDHSLRRPKSSGETLERTLERVGDEIARFTASR